MKYLKLFTGITISIIAIAGLALHFGLPKLGAYTQTRTILYDPVTDMHNVNQLLQDNVWHVYGGLQNNSSTIACTQDVWSKITNATGDLFTAVEVNGFTMTSDTMKFLNTGDYYGNLSLTVSGANGNDYFVRLFNTTTQQITGDFMGATMAGVNNFVPVPLPLYIEATANDEFILQIMNVTNDNDPIIRSAVFNINYLHD